MYLPETSINHTPSTLQSAHVSSLGFPGLSHIMLGKSRKKKGNANSSDQVIEDKLGNMATAEMTCDDKNGHYK